MRCPELEEIERHLSGTLADDARRGVAEHLEGCITCSDRMAEVADNLAALPRIREALRDEVAAETPPPERVGPYAIVREIARGGMGVIYLAVQERPRREVALKVLRPGVGSADAIRRFEREAEFLARLRHPGIATVYDAGVTTVSSGGVAERIPYIAMEYIRGERLDRHAGSRGLDVEQRLELVAKIADAVNHAHVHGLVHRDLKPGNILVVPPDGGGEGEPKVLDFGIARITGDDGAGTLQTSTGQLLGTIPYMSPEQLAGDPEAVDARSDVYSLGVIAYELLTGRLPHDVRRLSIAEAARVIRDVSPDPPGRLRPALRGDIETIVLKMLEKEPRRRYRTAVEAAEDIRRFLARKPVRARPAGPLYQLSRFAQRNRALATTFAGLVGVLVAAAVLSGALALRARRAERAAQRQLEEARRQAEKFEAVNLFLEEMMAAASPEDNPGGADVTVRESLGKGASRLDEGSLASQPAIELGVRTTIGNTYRALGENEAAREQLERAVVLGRALYPDGHEDLAFALNKLGRVLQALAAYDAAEEVFRESLTMRRALDAGSREVATSLNNLADVVSRRGRNEEALALHEEALALRRALLGPAHEEIANSLNNIAALHYSTGNVESAEAMFRESLEMDRALRGDLHPNVAATMSNLATVLSFLERYEEAEPLHRRALELEREIYGADHPRVARALRNLARFLVDTGRQEEAEPLLVEALDLTRRGHGMEHPAVAGALTDLAVLHEKRGDLERAESMYGEALAIRRATLGEDAVPTLGSRYSLARIAVERGHLDRAAAAYASVAEDARRLLPADSRYLFAILTGYGLCLAELERREDAVRVLEEARAVGLDSVGENAPRLAEVTATLARLRGAP